MIATILTLAWNDLTIGSMSELRLETLELPAARLGTVNPLAALQSYQTVSIPDATDAAASEVAYADRGNEASILP